MLSIRLSICVALLLPALVDARVVAGPAATPPPLAALLAARHRRPQWPPNWPPRSGGGDGSPQTRPPSSSCSSRLRSPPRRWSTGWCGYNGSRWSCCTGGVESGSGWPGRLAAHRRQLRQRWACAIVRRSWRCTAARCRIVHGRRCVVNCGRRQRRGAPAAAFGWIAQWCIRTAYAFEHRPWT